MGLFLFFIETPVIRALKNFKKNILYLTIIKNGLLHIMHRQRQQEIYKQPFMVDTRLILFTKIKNKKGNS